MNLIRMILVMLAAAALSVAPAQENYKNGQDLTGSWLIIATIPQGVPVCPGPGDCPYGAMATVSSDGTAMLTSAIPNTSTGHGAWKRTGLRSFRMSAVYFRFDAQGLQAGTSEASIEVQVDSTGRSATGSFQAILLGLNGAEQLRYSGTVTARRILVE
jgi:hypothetical protein